MKIEFQMVDNKHIKIIGVSDIDGKIEKHEIGEIFTPSSSSHDTLNAIQVCGFTEAYDLWGCASYARPGRDAGDVVMQDRIEQLKDVQLLFEFESYRARNSLQGCWGCFNDPCTCEQKIKTRSPYVVKSHGELTEQLQMKKDEKNTK